MSRRTTALVASVVLAALATIVIFSWVRGIEDRALGDAQPVEVYVAKDVIPQGVSGDSAISQGLIEQTTVPAKVRPPDAIATLEDIQGKVAAVTVQPQEVILASRFVAPGQAGGALAIPKDRVAIAIEVDVPPGVGGFIRQGDHLSAIGHVTLPAQAGRDEVQRSKFVVQNVEVLAVGRRVITTTEEGTEESTQQLENRVLVTVAVTHAQAERFVYLVNEGTIYFTLLPQGGGTVPTAGRTARNIFS
jgi:Flp pilus assembly protein CpaB